MSLKTSRNSPAPLAQDTSRFLSADACKAVASRIFKMGTPGAKSSLTFNSRWAGNIRWSRNAVSTGGDVQETYVMLSRDIRGAGGRATTNALDDATLNLTVARAEALAQLQGENPEQYPEVPAEVHPHLKPAIWFDETYNVDAEVRGKLAASIIGTVQQTEFLSAGYVEAGAQGACVMDDETLFRYYPYTTAQYSITVRDRKGTGSGWAGVDFSDWRRIDTAKLSQIAMDKCERSRNPVAVEPGRYTTILEPQAVCDLFSPILERAMSRIIAENGMGPFASGMGNSKIGEKILDERITISADPMDPDLGFVPFDWSGEPYQAVKWIENGVLKELEYPRFYGLRQLGKDFALSNSTAFRMSGGTTTLDEMVSTTRRGIYVTRFNNVQLLDLNSMLMTGNTRDGLWLIENGKITKTIKNFRFTESPLFIFNNLEQLGIAQRVFRPIAPTVCPPAKVNDFSFTGLMDAV